MTFTIDDIEIFITTHNRASYIKQSIESILNQTIQPICITILDNESTDDTEFVVSSFSSSCVKYVKTYGFLGNFNKAKEIASKKYVMLFHDDDILDPRYLNLAIDVLNKHENISLITIKGYREFTDRSFLGFTQQVNGSYYIFKEQKEFAKHMYFLEGVAYAPAIYRTPDGATKDVGSMRRWDFEHLR